MRTLALVALAAVAMLASCDGDSEPAQDPPESPAPERPDLAAGRLGDIQRELRSFEPSVMAVRDLPGVEPILKHQEERVGHKAAEAGLRADLSGKGVGYLYRYESNRLAEIAAPGFLGGDDGWAGGVGVCGPNVYFTDGLDQKQRDRWSPAAERAIRRIDPECRNLSHLVI
jgi:hypothetical protein